VERNGSTEANGTAADAADEGLESESFALRFVSVSPFPRVKPVLSVPAKILRPL